jgi:hypothetical protein
VRRDQLPPNPRHTFVLGRLKVVYVATPKAACSSLKWVIADIGGEDLSMFRPVDDPRSTGGASIHARGRWRHVPRLHDLPDHELAEIDPGDGWHVFAVVRHPATRLWSAWQQKVLLCAPGRAQKVPEHRLPPPPRTTADLVEAFGEFVPDLAAGEFPDLDDDLHFQSQHHLLAPDRMPYGRVYTTGELGQAMLDLDQHVRAHGGGAVPPLPSSNETPLRPLHSVFTPATLSTIQRIYADDFRAWFQDADEVAPRVPQGEYPPELLAAVRQQMAENARARAAGAPATG